MSYFFWVAVVISVIAFGGMSSKGRYYVKLDRIWVPLYIISLVAATLLSGKFTLGLITAGILVFGNGLLWGIVWSSVSKK